MKAKTGKSTQLLCGLCWIYVPKWTIELHFLEAMFFFVWTEQQVRMFWPLQPRFASIYCESSNVIKCCSAICHQWSELSKHSLLPRSQTWTSCVGTFRILHCKERLKGVNGTGGSVLTLHTDHKITDSQRTHLIDDENNWFLHLEDFHELFALRFLCHVLLISQRECFESETGVETQTE